MTMFTFLAGIAAIIAGAIAAVTGFGVGSLLTPILSVQFGTQLAVAAVSIPHFFSSLARFWMLRHEVNRRVLITFGVTSAVAGLAGALLQSSVSGRVLTLVFALLLIFAGLSAVTGYSKRMRFGSKVAWVAGAVSGMLGGLVGNQGGIRSAALLGFQLERQEFVATATAIGLFVDGARMPIYLAISGRDLVPISGLIAVITIGCLIGTFLGTAALRNIPEDTFHRTVGLLTILLGLFMLRQGLLGHG